MIVEFFGPPGVGKTTLVRALGARLREAGTPFELLASERPAEQENARAIGARRRRAPPAAVLRRLGRPAVALLGAVGRFPAGGGLAGDLLARFPPADLMWRIRLRQYLVRLEHAWREAAWLPGIVLCDQGFVQALASLLVLGPIVADAALSSALARLPAADVLIRLDAPEPALTARLERRRSRQGRLERLLELDLAANLAFLPAISRLDTALARLGRSSARISCDEGVPLEARVEQTMQAIASASRAAWAGVA